MEGLKIDFADVKPSVHSWVIVGVMAVTFIVLMKWFVNTYPIPGLTDFFNAV